MAVYPDGSRNDWKGAKAHMTAADCTLYVKYDERYLYLFLESESAEKKPWYVGFDITPRSGAKTAFGYPVTFDRNADFLLIIDGKENTKMLVQERYEVLRGVDGYEAYDVHAYNNPPQKNSPFFQPIRQLLQGVRYSAIDMETGEFVDKALKREAVFWDTGKFTHGNGNPSAGIYNSLADICFGSGFAELRIPWQMLNFSDPSRKMVHDDYYETFGVENLHIEEFFIGVGTGDEEITLKPYEYEAWGEDITWHERLKQSYGVVKEYWRKLR